MRIFLLILFLGGSFGLIAMDGNRLEPDTLWNYKQVNGKELKMSVFLPDNYEGTNHLMPTIVIFHGGSWKVGEPAWHYPDCEYWSERGMIALSVEYRLKDRDSVEVPLECVKDAKSAIRFLRKNAGKLKVDPDKLVCAGGSAGGQMAAATAMISTENTNDDNDDATISCVPNAVILYNPFFHCEAELSPPNFITRDLPPVITFLGDADQAIPVKELRSFHHALKVAGNTSFLYIGKGGKHGFCNGRDKHNPYFYWSLQLEDEFLVHQGILSGSSEVDIPEGVRKLNKDNFVVYD